MKISPEPGRMVAAYGSSLSSAAFSPCRRAMYFFSCASWSALTSWI
jgi:hypothetical protein